MIGTRFGDWEVIGESSEGHKVLCKCICGTKRDILKNNLKRKTSTGCGCMRYKKAGDKRTNGGRDNPRLYRIWCLMKARCYNKNHKNSNIYSERGIGICDEWKDNFPNFLQWALENGYNENLTIDRIDNNLGYSPDNCKWATMTEQARNRRNNNRITINGVTKTLSEWAEYSGINRMTLKSRISKGWKEEELLIPTLGRGANGTNARK